MIIKKDKLRYMAICNQRNMCVVKQLSHNKNDENYHMFIFKSIVIHLKIKI